VKKKQEIGIATPELTFILYFLFAAVNVVVARRKAKVFHLQ